MRFALDSSLALAFVFQDEVTPEIEKILESLGQGSTAIVPALWRWEVANVLLGAERRGRISAIDAQRHLEGLKKLPIEIDSSAPEEAWSAALILARKHELTSYDAAYLEIALRRGIPLGSLDDDLRKAARVEGVAVLPETDY